MAKFCPNCGTENVDTAMNCANCGVAFAAAPAPAAPAAAPAGAKSKMAAGLLGIFLGAWGIHNFYLGYTSKAIIQIVVSIVTCGFGGLWGFIEGIMILAGSITTDAQGNPLV